MTRVNMTLLGRFEVAVDGVVLQLFPNVDVTVDVDGFEELARADRPGPRGPTTN